MGSIKSETTQQNVKNNAKPYGKIVLSLQNQLLPEEKLQTTPSQIDGLDRDTETDLRIYGCELIQTAGILLKLPQVAMATGQVLLQRFYYSKSLVRHPVEQTAMASICLASKIEEAPRRVRDVINVFNHIRQVTSNKNITPVILDQNYIQLKNQVIKAERRVLKELGFSVHIKHPHKIIVMYLQVLNYEKNQQLMQYSWNYMNDSLRTDVFVRYQPETVACACIYLTARTLKLPLPKHPHWFTLFGVSEHDIRQVCLTILRLYNRPKINADALEKKIEELCKKYQDAKVKARGNSGDNTPNNNSPSSPGVQKSSGAHNAWGGFIRTQEMQFKMTNILGEHFKVETEEKLNRSGSHIVPSSEKRSRSKSHSHSPTNKHHKRIKKHGRSRSRSQSRTHKKSHKRKTSYSRSRSNSPHKVARKGREKRRSGSISDDKEVRNDRYIDRYERQEKIEKYNNREEKYNSKEERERYVEKERYEEKFDRKERHEKNDKRYDRDRDDKYREDRYKEDRYKEDTRHNSREEKERYRKSKHRDEEKEREREKKDRRR